MPKRIIHYPHNNQTGKAILWYASTLVESDELVYAGMYTKDNVFTKDIMEQKIYNHLPYNKNFTISFEEHNIDIISQLLDYSPDCHTKDDAEFFYDIILSCDSNEIIDLFIKTSKQKYKEIILDDYEDLNQISCWLFEDGYWESGYKSKKRHMDTIYLPKKTKQKIVNDIDGFLLDEREEIYDKMGVPYKRNYLFEGLPGSGKTSLIRAIATKYNMDIAFITLTPKTTDSVISRGIRRIAKNSILVFEDVDCLFVDRKKGDTGKNCITLSGLLNALDGIYQKNGLITIMTTNYINRLEDALIRPGRIDYKITFKHAVKEQIEQMYKVFFPDREDTDEFIKKTKHIKMTTSALQQYLLENLFSNIDKNNNPLKNIADLEKLCQSNDITDKLYI